MKNFKRTDYQWPFIILFVLVGFLLSLLSLGIFYYHESQLRGTLNKEKAHSEFAIKTERFAFNIERFKMLLDSLADAPDFHRYLHRPLPAERTRATETFQAIMASHPSIMQLRYIDATGREKLRLDRRDRGENILVAAPEQLQDKSDRYYFVDAMAQDPQTLYASRLDLNVEHGTVELPYRPVIRLALPVIHDQKRIGILIVNLFMARLVANTISSPSFFIYLYDQDGYVLASNDPDTPSWQRYLSGSPSAGKQPFIYSDVLLQTTSETLYLGMRPKERVSLQLWDSKRIIFSLLLFIIPMGFILAYFLAKIPKRLFDAIEERESVMIQQSKMAAMGEMIGAIAHQWRQPLNAVGVIAQEIDIRYTYGNLSEAELNQLVEELQKYLEYMSKTIDDFRNFFKPSKQKAPFDVCLAVRDAVDLMSKQLESHGIAFEIVCNAPRGNGTKETAYIVDGYENEFKQVIINLLNNAKEAIDSRAETDPDTLRAVSIHISRSKEHITVHVRDTGGGIPQEIFESIFDVYVSTKHEQQGTGLGLYLAKVIIETNMGGTIRGKNIEGGAEFILKLPPSQSKGVETQKHG